MTGGPELFDELLAASEGALGRRDDVATLHDLGWFSFLAAPPRDVPVDAVAALFVAHGRVLATTPVLHHLAAYPYLAARSEAVDDDVAFAFTAGCTAGVATVLAPRHATVRRLVVDLPGVGPGLVERDAASAPPAAPLDPSIVEALRVPLASVRPLAVPDVGAVRGSSVGWARVAAAFEISGACDSVLAAALGHAQERRQFGTPIGTFQSVQHLMAWASVETESIRLAARAAARAWPCAPEASESTTAIALAARGGGRVLDHTLQVLGAPGFTWEHPHHRFQRRILLLGTMFGAPNRLLADLAARARAGGAPARPYPLTDGRRTWTPGS